MMKTRELNGSFKMGKNSHAVPIIYKNIEYECKKELYLKEFINECSYSNFIAKIKDGRIQVKPTE